MYKNTVISLQQEVEESNLNMLNQVKEMMELHAKGFQHTAANITINPILRPVMIENAIDTRQAIDELQKYKGNNPFAEEVLLYFRGNDFVYSSKGTSSLDTLMNYTYKFSDTTKNQLIDDLNESMIMTVGSIENNVYENGGTNLISYMFPIKNIGSVKPYGTVLFIVNESLLHDQIENILGNQRGSVYVIGPGEEIIAANNDGDKLRSESEIEMINRNFEPGIHTLNFNDEQFSLIRVESDAIGWSYVVLLPTKQFMEKVLEMKSFIFLLLAGVVIIGVGLSLMFTLNYYRPIRSLVDFVKPSSKGLSGKHTNEFDVIRKSMTETLQKIDAQKPLVKEHYLINLLKGKSGTEQELDRLLGSNDLQITGKSFYVVVASLNGELDNNAENLDNFISFSSNNCFCYGIELFEESKFAIIVNMIENNKDVETPNSEMISLIRDKIKSTGRSATSLGFGRIYNNIQDIHRSFIEATAALEYTFKTGKDSIIYFDEVKGINKNSSWYSFDEELTFIQSIKRADQKLALESLHNMFKSIKVNEQSILLLKCMSYDIINICLKTINNMGLDQFTNNLGDLLEFETLEELEMELEKLIKKVCSHVNETKESKNTQRITQILHYIQLNFKSYDLTLENLAGNFQMSSSYLSRYMKNQTGYTFTEYLLNLRMEEIKKELKQTNKTIKVIISEVGYADVPNFMRKFKQIEGITPGEFRKLQSDSSQKSID